MALLLSGFNPDAAKTVLSFFLALKLEKGIVLHVLKSALVNLCWTKEGSCSGKVPMAFCFDEDLEVFDEEKLHFSMQSLQKCARFWPNSKCVKKSLFMLCRN